MDNNTLKLYYEMFTAAWKLLRVFKNTKTDEDRQRLKHAGDDLYQKYHCSFMCNLIWAVYDELDRRAGIGTSKNKDRPREADAGIEGKGMER